MGKENSGVDYLPNDKDRLIATELAQFGVLRKHIALRIGICEDTLDKFYGADMRITKTDLHKEMGQVLYNLAYDSDKNVALKAATTIITKICKVEQPEPSDVSSSALSELKQVVDALVAQKEQQHEY